MPWNEIEFLPWDRFYRMTPPILRLEITRLEELIGETGDDLEVRNALVKVRYELIGFLAELESAPDGRLSDAASGRLQAAILNLPLDRVPADSDLYGRLSYVLDRLESVHKRIELLYH